MPLRIKPHLPCAPSKRLGGESAHDARPVTPHNPPLSLGFLATQGKSGRALPALGFALRSSPSELLRGLSASQLSRFAPLRLRSASLRLRANPAGRCPPWALPFAPVHPSYSGGSALRVSPSSAARRRRNKIQLCVFRGHAPRKTLCSGEMGRQFRRNRAAFTLHPLKKVLGLF